MTLLRGLILSATVWATAFATPVHADDLTGKEIATLITDKKVLLSTTWGAFPLFYRNGNTVVGDGSGLGLAKFFAPKETGKWWVKDEELCQQFPTWYKGQPLCFTIKQTGPAEIKWVREDGYAGTATISN